jgi:hypothetical protein
MKGKAFDQTPVPIKKPAAIGNYQVPVVGWIDVFGPDNGVIAIQTDQSDSRNVVLQLPTGQLIVPLAKLARAVRILQACVD